MKGNIMKNAGIRPFSLTACLIVFVAATTFGQNSGAISGNVLIVTPERQLSVAEVNPGNQVLAFDPVEKSWEPRSR